MGLGLVIRENKAFFILHLLLLIVGLLPLVKFEKVDLFLIINSFHHPWLDLFFRYVTLLGGSQFCLLLMAMLVIMKQNTRVLLTGAGSFISMLIIIQGIKRLTFFDQLRPIALISMGVPIRLVEGLTYHNYLSFPSGHTGTIFAATCLIHLLVTHKPLWLSVLLLCVACIVAYSRIYLCQHFYRDVYLGALIGTGSTTAVYTALKRWQGPPWLDQTW